VLIGLDAYLMLDFGTNPHRDSFLGLATCQQILQTSHSIPEADDGLVSLFVALGLVVVVFDLEFAAGVTKQTLDNWVRLSKKGQLTGAGDKSVSPGQMELARLRAENARHRMERDILGKATAYFAKQSL
jgi:hypothetical protein